MAKSEGTKGTQTELVNAGGTGMQPNPGEDEAQRKLADLTAREERLAREKRALEEREANLKRQEEEQARTHQAMEERARELREGARHLEAQQQLLEARTASGLTSAEASQDASEEPVALLNNSSRTIGAPDGTALVPTQVTLVSRQAYSRWFGRDGKPVPGVAEHFETTGGKRADLQEVSLKNLSVLPDEHALKVVDSSKDAALLEKFHATEPREGVKAAISKRLAALKAQR